MLRNFPAVLPILAQLAICLCISAFLPGMIWISMSSSNPPPDSSAIQNAFASIQKRIDDADTPEEKAFQAREMEIAREKYAIQGRSYRQRFLWRAYPIGLMGLTFGVLGLGSLRTKPPCEIKSALQQAEERDDLERMRSRWYWCNFGPYLVFPEATLGLFLFAGIYQFAPIAWGLLLGGFFSLTMAGYHSWP